MGRRGIEGRLVGGVEDEAEAVPGTHHEVRLEACEGRHPCPASSSHTQCFKAALQKSILTQIRQLHLDISNS